MARRRGLPQGTLDTLIDETHDAELRGPAAVVVRPRKARKAVPPYTTRASRRAASAKPRGAGAIWDTDPVSRYAAARGLPVIAGALPSIRLALQYAMDVREVARRERTNVFSVVSKALAGYLNAYERL